MMELTQEKIQRSILAAFDSVSLINDLNLIESLNSEEIKIKKINVQHLKIMLSKEWFLSNLTEKQLSKIQEVIS